MKSVVVTGSSTGIGWGAAKVLIQKGFRVFGSVRKEADGERLEKEFGAELRAADIRRDRCGGGERGGGKGLARRWAARRWPASSTMPGIAVAGPLLYLKIDEFRQQLEVNVTGQVIVTQAFAPLLGADRSRKGEPGRIVMISSVGGRNANPFMGPYNASKFAHRGPVGIAAPRTDAVRHRRDRGRARRGGDADLGEGRGSRRQPVRQHALYEAASSASAATCSTADRRA